MNARRGVCEVCGGIMKKTQLDDTKSKPKPKYWEHDCSGWNINHFEVEFAQYHKDSNRNDVLIPHAIQAACFKKTAGT